MSLREAIIVSVDTSSMLKRYVFNIYIISESAKHPGFWYLADMVHKTVTTRPCKPEGLRYLLSQDVRINGGPRIVRWEFQPVEYLFDGAGV